VGLVLVTDPLTGTEEPLVSALGNLIDSFYVNLKQNSQVEREALMIRFAIVGLFALVP
jgi:hypothetical protein